jgi:hypothetical protein
MGWDRPDVFGKSLIYANLRKNPETVNDLKGNKLYSRDDIAGDETTRSIGRKQTKNRPCEVREEEVRCGYIWLHRFGEEGKS